MSNFLAKKIAYYSTTCLLAKAGSTIQQMPQPNLSYWEQNSFIGRPDLLIIGSGIVGLTAALEYRRRFPKAKILVVERSPIAAGGSTRNAGFACFGSISEILADLENHDEQTVIDLIKSRWDGLALLRKLIGDQNMNYQAIGNYEIFRNQDIPLFESCIAAMPRLNAIMETATRQKEVFKVDSNAIRKFGLGQTQHLIWNKAEGMINTGKMMQTLIGLVRKSNIQIMNGVAVEDLSVEDNQVSVLLDNTWEIKAHHAIVATNGFARQLLPKISVRPARNLVLITQPIDGLKIKGAFHGEGGYYYFRNIDNRILLGGGRHLDLENEATSAFGQNELIKTALLKLLETTILPGESYVVDRWWSGILGVGTQKKPIIEKYHDRLVVAVRMGGMGVAIGSSVGVSAVEKLIV